MWTFEHKKTGWKFTVVKINQGMLERWFKKYRHYAGTDASATEQLGATVKAAVDAKWLEEKITVKEVEEMNPGRVRWMAEKINEVYEEITAIPPE